MSRRLKLMADYHSFALWEPVVGDSGNLDPETLPISNELKAALLRWPEQLDNALNWGDPAGTAWPEGFWIRFNAEGNDLAIRLRAELGPDFEIESSPNELSKRGRRLHAVIARSSAVSARLCAFAGITFYFLHAKARSRKEAGSRLSPG